MTIKQRIDKFVKKYPEPYQFKIELRWSRKDGLHRKKYFEGNKSGKRRWSDAHFVTSTGRDFIVQHYRYDEKLGLLELAFAHFDCHVPKKDENRRWEYGYRYFIPKDTRDLYDINGKQWNYTYSRITYDAYCSSPSVFAQNFSCLAYVREMFQNEFFEFAGNNLQTSSSWCKYITKGSSPWMLSCWFEYTPKQRTTGKVQKSIDELTAKELKLSDKAKRIIMSKFEDSDYHKKYAWFDLDNRVFRCYVETVDGMLEDKRVYLVDKSKPIVATITPSGEWVTNGSFTDNQFNFQIVNLQDVFKLPYHDYLKKIVVDNATVYRIVSAMKHPEIEQFTNMGLTNIADKLYRTERFAGTITEIFGKPNKKKAVLARYNINKKQAKYVNDLMNQSNSWYYHNSYKECCIANIKEYMGVDNVASLNDDTFMKYCNFVKDLDWSDRREIKNLSEDIRQKTVLKLCNMREKHESAVRVFFDTLRSFNSLAATNRPNVDVYTIKSYGELVRLHDTCVELKRLQDEERRRLYNMAEAERHALLEKKMAKLDEERSKFNYSDDNFTIRLPEKLSEIVNEGSALRHCVAGYTNNHAEGHTTIMFLRRNSDPTTSFYTIEIRNDNTISQIHGFGNKWLGNNPEAIPTVMRWLRENNLYCSDQILLSTATGYFAGNAAYVEKPII